jgi:very-short-patch-repair endonuclease
LDVKGSHFRRQVVIGPYIADFACLAQRLIVEVDGSQHGDDEGLRRRRSVALAAIGRLQSDTILE